MPAPIAGVRKDHNEKPERATTIGQGRGLVTLIRNAGMYATHQPAVARRWELFGKPSFAFAYSDRGQGSVPASLNCLSPS
jgi:hypothetical protein